MHDTNARPANTSESPSTPSRPELSHYELFEALGRGGMGVVYAARDLRLNREVALKLLRDEYAADSRMVARFNTEAQITGQLQHPGIPAIHELGALPDGRPFLAMKLVKGKTLAALLQERADPEAQRGQLLAIFEHVCQAVSYAHARRVIHRDLKPTNVMVGKFGEVQVMDWGLAKVLPTEGMVPPSGPEGVLPDTGPPVTSIDTPAGDGWGTRTGHVLGTPAYIAPEQAGGERSRVDTRSDVFGLGAILCEVLTGQPPYQGTDANAVRLQAVRGELDDALARLDGCKAEASLVALCRRCLAFRQEDRPPDAGAVAAAVADIRAAAEERARQAERARAEALVREAEQRKRRRIWLVGAVVVACLALWADYLRRQAEAREAEARVILDFMDLVENRVFAVAGPKRAEGDLDPDSALRRAVEQLLPSVEGRFAEQPLIEARLRLTLGNAFMLLRDAEQARQQYQRALELRKARLGDRDRETLRIQNNLNNTYEALGRTKDALRLREETLALMRGTFGADAPETLISMTNLANSYAALGQPTDALRLRQETLELRRTKFGADHADTLLSMHNLASSYEALGRYADALKLYQETLERRRATLGSDHPDTLTSLHDLALVYLQLRQDVEGGELFQEALKRSQQLAANQPGTVRAQLLVAYFQGRLGGVEEVRQHFVAAAAAYSLALDGFHQLATAGKLQDPYFARAQDFFCLRRDICRKVEQAVADLNFALGQPAAEVPDLLDTRLRVLLGKKDRASAAATAAAWQQLAEKDPAQCYDAAAAWSLASSLAPDKERAKDTAKALELLRGALKAKQPSPTPLLLAWRLEQNPDFTLLRSQPDFVAFLQELHAAGEAGPRDTGPKKD